MAVLAAIARAYHGISAPLPPADAAGGHRSITAMLPYYALRTTLRMFAALVCFVRLHLHLRDAGGQEPALGDGADPVLDILQSVPILGFLSFTVTFFLGLFPGNVLGAECAAIFAIFTSQAWNMAFSFYQSLRTVPRDLDEVARGFRLTGWQKFWQLEAPFAVPGLIWNTMMSMSGGWFFVVASEAITVGDTTITLPGVGSYIAEANNAGRLGRDPRGGRDDGRSSSCSTISCCSGRSSPGRRKFRVELSVGAAGRALLGARTCCSAPTGSARRCGRCSPALRSAALLRIGLPPHPARRARSRSRRGVARRRRRLDRRRSPRSRSTRCGSVVAYVATELGWPDVGEVSLLTFYTLLRVVVLMALATVVLGADQRLDRTAAALGRGDAADRAVSRRLPGQPAVRRGGQPGAGLQPQSRHLAQRAHRLRHAMVHRVQHHRRRGGVSQRPARGGGQFPRPRLGLVAQGHPARRRALLPHRRDHRFGRIVERLDRRRIRQMEGPDGRRARRRRLYRARRPTRATSPRSCSASR